MAPSRQHFGLDFGTGESSTSSARTFKQSQMLQMRNKPIHRRYDNICHLRATYKQCRPPRQHHAAFEKAPKKEWKGTAAAPPAVATWNLSMSTTTAAQQQASQPVSMPAPAAMPPPFQQPSSEEAVSTTTPAPAAVCSCSNDPSLEGGHNSGSLEPCPYSVATNERNAINKGSSGEHAAAAVGVYVPTAAAGSSSGAQSGAKCASTIKHGLQCLWEKATQKLSALNCFGGGSSSMVMGEDYSAGGFGGCSREGADLAVVITLTGTKNTTATASKSASGSRLWLQQISFFGGASRRDVLLVPGDQ